MWTAHATGNPLAFVLAVLLIAVWLVTGPLFRVSDTWQQVLNTGTTSATFLMVFRIQNPQNRDGAAAQLKSDELLRAVAGAHTARLDLKELAEGDLERLRGRYQAVARGEETPWRWCSRRRGRRTRRSGWRPWRRPCCGAAGRRTAPPGGG